MRRPGQPVQLAHHEGICAALFTFNWLEYIGANLLEPMLAGEEYTISMMVAAVATDGVLSESVPIFYGPVDVTIFGYTSTAAFPVGTTECPVGFGWTELGHVTYDPVDAWTNISISSTRAVCSLRSTSKVNSARTT